MGVSGRAMLAALVAGMAGQQILAHVDYLNEAITQVDERIAAALEPSQGRDDGSAEHPGDPVSHRGGRDRRDRDRHEPLPDEPPSRVVGGYAPATTRARGSASTAERRKAVPGCGLRWLRRRSARPARTATCRRSTDASAVAVGTSAP